MKTNWPLTASLSASRWISFAFALLFFVGVSSYIWFRVEAGLIIRLFFIAITLGFSGLLGIFVESFVARFLTRAWKAEVSGQTLSIHSQQRTQSFDLSQPFELSMLRSEGDHKERGGSVLVQISQGEQSAKLLGALPREAFSKESEALFLTAKEVPIPTLFQEGSNALWFAKDGDIAQVLSALSSNTKGAAEAASA